MPSPPAQRIVDAHVHRVPLPFRSFAVRSDEARHAFSARAPYGKVHALRLDAFDAGSLAGLAAEGRARVDIELIVDGNVVDLNSVPLPENTLIVDRRFPAAPLVDVAE